ncbi:nucleotidyltransferase family protein [Guptibacillus hwajinpoensis]|uniref:nucleotidyltransferase family protein n=1 Tax=Guptibacillus hwajinpoensis TaxID=208199 RepID=UPI001CD2B5DD|nr:nucleotidyltransferase family protein [Pseudalkalibacillus hwajinpoensis]MCA0993454.1 nucleotidyltransferase family protein [Pseudalkalibacillus hwajinpoensis]
MKLIENDERMMEIIKAASQLNLPDWWICAGFVRSKIWDTLHGFEKRTDPPDVDVIYYNLDDTREKTEKELEAQLKRILPGVPWSVKNEARMHVINHIEPYTSAEDAISKFPETATALGVKIDKDNNLILTAPWGVDDVIHLEVKATPFFRESKERAAIYKERVIKKDWKEIWKKIEVYPL